VTNLLVLLPTVGNCRNRSAGDAMHAETMAPVTALLDEIVVGIHSAGRAQSGSCDTTRLW